MTIMPHHIARAALAIFALTSLGGTASGQSYPGLTVSVIPTGITTAGATTSITFVTENSTQSQVALEMLVLDAPIRPSETVLPPVGPDADYMLRYGYGTMNAVSLGFLYPLRPGQRQGPFTIRTAGLPAIVPFWVVPDLPVEEITEQTGPVDGLPQGGAFTLDDRAGLTVGVEPAPADQSVGALTGRLSTLLDGACNLGWVLRPQGVCTSLQVKLREGQLGAFLNELDAQRGKSVTETAYFLLRANAEYILAPR
jgi:hypothetical protein